MDYIFMFRLRIARAHGDFFFCLHAAHAVSCYTDDVHESVFCAHNSLKTTSKNWRIH